MGGRDERGARGKKVFMRRTARQHPYGSHHMLLDTRRGLAFKPVLVATKPRLVTHPREIPGGLTRTGNVYNQ